MRIVAILCPKTGQHVSTGFEANSGDLQRLSFDNANAPDPDIVRIVTTRAATRTMARTRLDQNN